jgi:hypothetical protein
LTLIDSAKPVTAKPGVIGHVSDVSDVLDGPYTQARE